MACPALRCCCAAILNDTYTKQHRHLFTLLFWVWSCNISSVILDMSGNMAKVMVLGGGLLSADCGLQCIYDAHQ